MNKRIEELAERYVTRFELDMDGSMEPEELGDWVRFEDLEKFAELIVKECMARSRADENSPSYEAAARIADLLE